MNNAALTINDNAVIIKSNWSGVLEEVCNGLQCHLLSIFAMYQVVFDFYFILPHVGKTQTKYQKY